MVTTTDQITALEVLLARVEAGETSIQLGFDIVCTFEHPWRDTRFIKDFEAADAFERAVYPHRYGEPSYMCDTHTAKLTHYMARNECWYERGSIKAIAPTLAAAKVAWVIMMRIVELKAVEAKV